MTSGLYSKSLSSYIHIQCSYSVPHDTLNKLILSARFGSQDYRLSFSGSLLGAPTHTHKNQIIELATPSRQKKWLIYLCSKNDTVHLRLYIMFIVFFSIALKIHLAISLLAGLYMQIIQTKWLKSELNISQAALVMYSGWEKKANQLVSGKGICHSCGLHPGWYRLLVKNQVVELCNRKSSYSSPVVK